jgi:hypothetical protein
MCGSPHELFDTVVMKCIGNALPPRIIEAWEIIHRIRNKGSHTEPLDRADYEAALTEALAPEVLGILGQIKQALSARPTA